MFRGEAGGVAGGVMVGVLGKKCRGTQRGEVVDKRHGGQGRCSGFVSERGERNPK